MTAIFSDIMSDIVLEYYKRHESDVQIIHRHL
jgi:hypothetical protein